MGNPLAAYMRRHPPDNRWPMQGFGGDAAPDMVVVIPALAEYECLFHTLESLARAAEEIADHVLVVCVVNNRNPLSSTAAERENNAHTLDRLQDVWTRGAYAPLRLAWVDASSPGRELPDGEGVGLARKIGLDHGFRVLHRNHGARAPLINLDADTLVEADYLQRLRDFYSNGVRWGGYAGYAHTLNPQEPQYPAMIAYECRLRYHELSLRWAGSPYAYPALGSVVSCTAVAYAASGGMNRRLAGEDFYFLQQLVKTGTLEPVPGSCVHPSSRRSQRAPFGTGRALDVLSGDATPVAVLYHPQVYAILRRWLSTVAQHPDAASEALLERAGELSPTLRACIELRGFPCVWERIRRQYPDPAKRLHQFHVWFDGLRTIQLIHRLREEGYRDLPLEECLTALFRRLGMQAATSDSPSDAIARRRALLERLRRLCGGAPG